MRLTTGFGALAHGRGRRVAVAGTLAAAAALTAGVVALASGPTEDESHRASPREEVAAAPAAIAPTTSIAPASTALSTTARPDQPAPASTVPQRASAELAPMSGDAGDESGEYGEYGEYAESPGCDEGPLPAGPLADGHHMVLLVGVDIEASTVELVEFGLLEPPVHVMRVTPGYDLTGLTGVGQAVTYSATIEGGVITLLEPLS